MNGWHDPAWQWLAGDALRATARRLPRKVALETDERTLSYGALHRASVALADALHDDGVQPGDRVVIFTDNSWVTVVAIYGVWYAGGAVVVVNPQTKADKLAYLLTDSGARAVVTDAALARTFRPAVARTARPATVWCAGRPTEGTRSFEDAVGVGRPGDGHGDGDGVEGDGTERPRSDRPGALATDLAALIYTSGSTGDPKGVMVTHQNVTFTSASLVEYLRLDQDDRILNLLPLAFDYGLYQLLMSVRIGATLVLERGFGFPAAIRRRLHDAAITVFPGVPTVFAALIAGEDGASFPSVRRVTNTAASLSPAWTPRLRALFPGALLFRMYGLTECKRVCYLEPEEIDRRPESVGRAIPGTEAFLRTPDDGPVAAGGTGILHVRGPHVMVGYWNKPAETAHMLRPGRHPAERVLCTHDWFRLDEDGYLYFLGRSDDIIKSRGEKVSPVEVENVLHGIAGVRDAAVVGVPDPVLGEAIRAYVSCHPGVELTPADIRRGCQARLENYMVPGDVVFLAELPKTETGKVRKRDLMEASMHDHAIAGGTRHG